MKSPMEVKDTTEDSREEFLKKIQWLMFLRVIGVTFFLGSTILINLRETQAFFSPFLIYLYSLIGVNYLLTIIYVVLLKFLRSLKPFAYIQIVIDVFFVTGVIYATGGKDSVFSFMYIFPIIYASIILYRKGGMLIASISSIVHGLYLDFEFYQLIKPISGRFSEIKFNRGDNLIYYILIDISAFYLTAFLSSFLAEQLKKSRVQLQKKEVVLRELEILHKNIIQSMGSGLLTLDTKDRVTFINRAGEEITGFSFFEACNKPFNEIFSQEEILSDNSPNAPRWETVFKRRDGTIMHLGFSVSTLKDSKGTVNGKIVIFQDLTKIKEMEEQIRRSEKLAALGHLAAGIAHEIRNPLASMSGSIQLLKKELRLDSESQHLMDIVLKETERLNKLISEFLLFAQPSTKYYEDVNLGELVEDVLKLFIKNPEWKEGIEIRKYIDKGIYLKGNSEHFRQILWNLITNAIQSMEDGGRLTVTLKKYNGGDIAKKDKIEKISSPFVKISVSDTGCGIHKEDLDKIFDPFFTTKEKGTGLGLSIVHRIVEDYKGNISVKSVLGKGTVFTITLPLEVG